MDLRAGVEDIARDLSSWQPGDAPAVTWVSSRLRELLGAAFVGAYEPIATDRGWSIDSIVMVGVGETASASMRAFRACVEQLPPSDNFLAFNPYVVQMTQRNRPLRFRNLPRELVERFNETVARPVGILGHDQLRVLLCDGPRLLSWFGATRPESFTAREVAAMRRLVRPLQKRLRFERQLRPRWPSALAVDAIFEALDRPAFIIGPRGAIEAANRRGAALLENGCGAVRQSIRESQRNRHGLAEFSITPLTVVGLPPHWLAVGKPRLPGVAERLAAALERWKLTPRQTRVLELMSSGATNKQIAASLGCAIVTVENHITELFRRSGTRSRSELVVRLWSMA